MSQQSIFAERAFRCADEATLRMSLTGSYGHPSTPKVNAQPGNRQRT